MFLCSLLPPSRAAGLEPTTYGFGDRCAQLRQTLGVLVTSYTILGIAFIL